MYLCVPLQLRLAEMARRRFTCFYVQHVAGFFDTIFSSYTYINIARIPALAGARGVGPKPSRSAHGRRMLVRDTHTVRYF